VLQRFNLWVLWSSGFGFDVAFGLGLVLIRLGCIARYYQRVGTIHIVIYMSIDESMLLLELGE
jgi:hypothetical protein